MGICEQFTYGSNQGCRTASRNSGTGTPGLGKCALSTAYGGDVYSMDTWIKTAAETVAYFGGAPLIASSSWHHYPRGGWSNAASGTGARYFNTMNVDGSPHTPTSGGYPICKDPNVPQPFCLGSVNTKCSTVTFS